MWGKSEGLVWEAFIRFDRLRAGLVGCSRLGEEEATQRSHPGSHSEASPEATWSIFIE